MSKVGKYIGNVLYALDQFGNALLAGDPNETMSSRMGKEVQAGRCVVCKGVCWLLSLIEKDHCLKHIEVQEQIGPRDLVDGK